VLAGRGVGRLVALLGAEAGLAALDFDALADWLPDAAHRLAANFDVDVAKLPERDRKSEVFLVGWSPRLSHYVAHVLELRHDGRRPSHVVHAPDAENGCVIASPWHESLGPLPQLSDLADDGFVTIARRQVDVMNTRWSPDSAGGDLVVTLLTPDRMVSRRYPLRVADNERFAAA
jgi:hypothetical protein